MKRPCSLVLLLLVLGSGGSMHAGSKDTQQSSLIGGKSIEYILERLGARMEHDLSFEQHQRYVQHFDFVDTDHNGRLTVQEFVENGTYRTPQARQGIFRASDENGDGTVTMDEYVINRVITDEAKSLLNAMDDDQNGVIRQSEFLAHTSAKLSKALSMSVFHALDSDDDGSLMTPEYLRVWGTWARTDRAPAEQRLAARRARELNRYWHEVSRTVREGDFEGYAATCHPDGVLVSGARQRSYPLDRALKGWRQGFLDTASGRMKASVAFRFSKRLGDLTTAHEQGIFRYAAEEDGVNQVSFIHFEALLIRKAGRWQILMEHQQSEASEQAWNALDELDIQAN